MKPEYAAALVAFIKGDPEGFAAACESVSPDNAESLATECLNYLADEAGTEDNQEGDNNA